MSNCIRIPGVEFVLRPEHLLSKPPASRDLDGNEVFYDAEGSVIFAPASFTTWRGLKNFVRKYIAPHVKHPPEGKVSISIPHCSEEGDGFASFFTLVLKLVDDYDHMTSEIEENADYDPQTIVKP